MPLARALRAAVPLAIFGSSCAGPSRAPQLEPSHDEHPVLAVAVREEPEPPPLPPNVARATAPRHIGRCEPSAESYKFTVAHLNDMQARYSERIAGRSRYAYVAGYLRALKDEVPETLVLDAGDDYEKGSIADLRSMGEATRLLVQALPIDVRTIGNHDFAYGKDAVLRDVQLSVHPVLAANVAYKDGSSPFLPYVRVDVGCVKVGIVGLVTQNYGANDRPSKEPYDGVLVQNERYTDVLDALARAHRSEVDVMIALDHLGLYEDALIASRVPSIDLFVGGHSEDLVKDPLSVTRADGSRAWVVQAGHFARTIGRLDLAFSPRDRRLSMERARIVEVDGQLPYVEEVAELAKKLEREYAPEAHAPIAYAKSEVRQGQEMADLLWRAAREQWAVDAMIVGRDLFWDGLPAGPITLQRLYDAVLVQREPAGTTGFSSLYVLELKGAELIDLQSKAFAGPMFAVYAPSAVSPSGTYRLAIEKRAMTYPSVAFRGPTKLAEGRYAGEMIDLVESYARARTRRGLSID